MASTTDPNARGEIVHTQRYGNQLAHMGHAGGNFLNPSSHLRVQLRSHKPFPHGPMETLTDFKYYFTGEWEIDAYLTAALGQ